MFHYIKLVIVLGWDGILVIVIIVNIVMLEIIISVAQQENCFSQHGGFAEQVTANEVSVIPIPNGVNHQDAGPLLCGGITVFTPMVEFNINKDHRVGIIGIGGLGHLAIKFYKALGCM